MAGWPKRASYKNRFFVADLSPEQRTELKGLKPRFVFVAESPHVSEVKPTAPLERRPLCGSAGQEWWSMVGGLVEGDTSKDTSLERLVRLTAQARIAVLNAVQYPIDPKIVMHVGEAGDPVDNLGFSKVAPASYKKLKSGPDVEAAIEALRERLFHPSLANVPVISLGLDAQWFVSAALGAKVGHGRHLETVPHPSAWWRAGGKFREKARGQLTTLLTSRDQIAHRLAR